MSWVYYKQELIISSRVLRVFQTTQLPSNGSFSVLLGVPVLGSLDERSDSLSLSPCWELLVFGSSQKRSEVPPKKDHQMLT